MLFLQKSPRVYWVVLKGVPLAMQMKGNDSSLFSPSEASFGALDPVLSPILQERCGQIGKSSVIQLLGTWEARHMKKG